MHGREFIHRPDAKVAVVLHCGGVERTEADAWKPTHVDRIPVGAVENEEGLLDED